ncbi:MAG: biotin--[acetyl-CoA-carboxylase] ligase [Halovenus sp.]
MQETRGQILETLSEGAASGPELADNCDVSRAAVWKHIEALRDAGFEIHDGTDGYELQSVPEFGGAAVEFGLDAPYDIEYHDSIGSTNGRARELAREGRSDVVVLSDQQTGGRGRLDREWQSPTGGVWLSVLARPEIPPAHAPAMTLAAAVATTRAVRDLGVDASIKWPNDVLVGDRKLAGILTEMEGEADRVSWLVVGIGLNANVDVAALPADLATSLRAEVGVVDRRTVTQHLLSELATLTDDLEGVLSAWREYASTPGRRVRIETGTREIVGTAVDIEFPGSLVVDTGTGRVTVSTGDCEHLRPVDP